MGIGAQTKEALLAAFATLYPDASNPSAQLTLYHLLLLLKRWPRAQFTSFLHSCAKSQKWTEEKLVASVEIQTLKLLHSSNSLVWTLSVPSPSLPEP